MSYEEKGIWVYLAVNVVTFTAYIAVILSRTGDGGLTEVPYVSPLLWTIGIAIGASVVGRVLMEIAKPSESHRSDVRDKEINRLGEYVGGTILSIGMLLPFVLALADADHFWIANGMYAVYVLAGLVGPAVKLIAYRRGM
ncbi:hypothetical protein ACFXJ8_31165 [Nonomuraea sp. NPDC059194]|uniref:hypothetical protein n=1 Tax=Nonomuraea sp. NPDC059194 TaxID=3346764 RepID=UPI0036926591